MEQSILVESTNHTHENLENVSFYNKTIQGI